MTDLLSIQDLCVEGQSGEEWNSIVNGISLKLNRGEVLGLIGESGAGKSTLGLTAMGYTKPGCRIVSGSIKFKGMELTDAVETEKRRIRGVNVAYVAQSAAAAFNPAHRLIRQFSESAVHHGLMKQEEAERKGRELFKRLDLPEPDRIGNRWPHQVSGGQLQRAMVAMAMACSPDILVFDEPTTALDVTTQIEVLAAIKEVVRFEDAAAIYITHDLAVVTQLADHIMVLRYGDLVEEGATGDILKDAKKTYTRELLSVRSRQEMKTEQSPAGKLLLQAKEISASYGKGGVRVLQNVSLEVLQGRTLAVVGESGSGKSTLARVICGLLPALEGSIEFDGKVMPRHLKKRNRDQLRRIQMIYQMPDVALNPKQKVREIIGRPLSFYLGMQGTEKENRTVELLGQIELSADYIDRFPAELSGGEKQRICIARALAAEPDLIICDEVTSALDTIVGKSVLDLLQRLQDQLKLTYLFITHDLEIVSNIADQALVLYAGRIVEFGSKREVFNPPFHPYSRLLLSSVPEMRQGWLEETLSSREAGASISKEIVISDKGCPFSNRCPMVISDDCEKLMPVEHQLSSQHFIHCHHSPDRLDLS